MRVELEIGLFGGGQVDLKPHGFRPVGLSLGQEVNDPFPLDESLRFRGGEDAGVLQPLEYPGQVLHFRFADEQEVAVRQFVGIVKVPYLNVSALDGLALEDLHIRAR